MENVKLEAVSDIPQSDTENLTVESEVTTPESQPNFSTKPGITLKFNKELREIPYDEAILLAQKGLKFDTIRPDFERLKGIAAKEGKSVSDYITAMENDILSRRREKLLESCAGNEDLTEHILSLENAVGEINDSGFSLLKAEFPEINSPEDLPSEVLREIELLGGNYLSSYLLYLHRQQRAAEESRIKQSESSNSSVGSLSRHAAENSGVNEEFIKAIWS